jgi:metal-dependent hydrolase (beta-lactamase superfamily II)
MIEFRSHYSSSKGNLYQVSDNKTSLLLDPGVPIAQIKKALNFKLSGISASLLSHAHADHAEGASGVMTSGVDLYCSQDTAETLKLSGHRLHIIKHKIPFIAGTFTVLPLSVRHDEDTPTLAFLLISGKEKWFFGIDLLYCPYYFKDLTGIAIGINYETDILKDNVKRGSLHPALAKRIMQSHCSLQTSLDFFKAQDLSKIKEIHVLHCSEANADKDRIKKAVMRQTGKLVII